MNLYTLSSEFQQLYDALDGIDLESGDGQEQLAAYLDTLEGIEGEFEEKAGNLGAMVHMDWKQVWNSALKILLNVKAAVANAFRGMVNYVISSINRMIRGINSLDIPFIGNLSIPTIPMLASGGVLSRGSAIVGEAGPELLTVSGNRAVVQPLTNSTTNNQTANFGGITVNVYANGDIAATAEQIAEEIQQAVLRKGMVFA